MSRVTAGANVDFDYATFGILQRFEDKFGATFIDLAGELVRSQIDEAVVEIGNLAVKWSTHSRVGRTK